MPKNSIISENQFKSSSLINENMQSQRKHLEKIRVFMINIQSVRAHQAELSYHLQVERPHIVLLQETWLDASIEDVQIQGYDVVSRRDRSDSPNRGGILTLKRSDFNHIVHVSTSTHEERAWYLLNLDPEVILIGNWYRPGASEHDGFKMLYEEVAAFTTEFTGMILMGDLNVHHAKWLRFSNGNSIVGADLKAFSENYGLHQLVKEPTRNEYLLDLLLTDIAGAKVKVGSYVADHKYLLAQIPAPEISQTMIKRKGFKLA